MTLILEVILASLISNVPEIAIATVGLVLVHTKLKRLHPRAYFYGTLGFVLLLAHGLLGVAIRAYLLAYATNYENGAALANKLTMVNLVGFVVLAVSLVLILVALLADRTSATSPRVAA